MVPGALSTVRPWRAASPERGRTCASMAARQRDGDAGRNQRARARRERERRIGRHRGEQIEAGGERALIGRQRQILCRAAAA